LFADRKLSFAVMFACSWC